MLYPGALEGEYCDTRNVVCHDVTLGKSEGIAEVCILNCDIRRFNRQNSFQQLNSVFQKCL